MKKIDKTEKNVKQALTEVLTKDKSTKEVEEIKTFVEQKIIISKVGF